jgi:hypothetical protein
VSSVKRSFPEVEITVEDCLVNIPEFVSMIAGKVKQ